MWCGSRSSTKIAAARMLVLALLVFISCILFRKDVNIIFSDIQPINPSTEIQYRRQLSRSSLSKFLDPKSTEVRIGKHKDEAKIIERVQRNQEHLTKVAEAAIKEGYPAFHVRNALTLQEEENAQTIFTPSEIIVEIHNPNVQYQYSVTIQSYNKYTGTAILQTDTSSNYETLVYSWTPIFPGQYDVLVHEIDLVYEHTTPLIQPGSYPIYVNEGSHAQGVGISLLQDRIENMPPCSTIRNNVQLFTHWDGDWLGPDFHLDETSMRSGWSFVPSTDTMNCKLETFSAKELQSIPEKKSIYIVGRSVERGIFLSLIDVMLEERAEKKNLFKNSEIGKCWGRASVQKGNLEVLYQDFRVNAFEDPTESNYIECHNEKMVKEPGSSFIENATQVWSEIFEQEESDWPNVIYLVTGWGTKAFLFEHHVARFVQMLPPTWNGILFLGDFEFSGRGGGLVSTSQYEFYLQEVNRLVLSLGDQRVRWIDGVGVSKEMRMFSQKGPQYVGRAQHFHHPCMHIDPKDHTKAMVTCSNITEMMGQLLLGHALGPKDEFMARAEQAKKEKGAPPTDLRWCHACPKCMLPFHITPHPTMTCVDGPIVPKLQYDHCIELRWEEGKGEDPRLCPAACLERPVIDSFGSESDTVYVRKCPIELNI